MNANTCLTLICELRDLVDTTTEHLHKARVEVTRLQQSNAENEANIRSLMNENGLLQEAITQLELEKDRLKQKYEVQRQ